MPSEISHRKTNTVQFHLYVESKKYNKLVSITTTTTKKQGQDMGRGVRGTNYYV